MSINEFILVTDKNSDEKFFINLSDISFIREIKKESCSVIKLRSKDKSLLQVKENFDSFENFFDSLDKD